MNDSSAWGHFAVVSYVPEPLASFIYDLRASLPGGHNPRPHITVLPPRPLHASAEVVSADLQQVLERWQPFPVQLGEVAVFPETAILYLSVGIGLDELHQLHRELAHFAGDHQEQYPFRPHLTLGGPIEDGLQKSIENARAAWRHATCQREFLIESFEFLWLEPEAGPADWQCLRTHSLLQTKMLGG